MFVDVKLVNGYNTTLNPRGINYVVTVLPLNISATVNNSSSTPPAFNLTEQTRTLGNNLAANSYGLLGAPSGSPVALGTAPPPDFSVTYIGDPDAGVPTLQSISVVLSRVRLMMSVNNADIIDWMAPSDFTYCYSGGMTFSAAGSIVPYISGTSPNFTGSGGVGPYFSPLGLGKNDPRTRTFSAPGVLSYGSGSVPTSFEPNWFALSTTGPNLVQPIADHSFNPALTPTTYNLLADAQFIEPNLLGLTAPSHRVLDPIAETAIQSLGELTYIHTGYPWRTIRFRSVYPETAASAAPSPSSLYAYADPVLGAAIPGVGDPNVAVNLNVEINALPDWIMLDMFKVGSVATVPGRININAKFTGPATALTPRFVPLAALLDYTEQRLSTDTTLPLPYSTNLLVSSGPTFGQGLASNILTRVLVPNQPGLPNLNPYAALPAYFTPGQICEVENMGYFSDNVGGSPYYDYPSKTRRQQIIRRISNLITTRSNLFTIWAVAQSIKKVNPNPATAGVFIPGTDIITGEVKVQAIVERYEDPTVSVGLPARVKFRTLYYRYYYQ